MDFELLKQEAEKSCSVFAKEFSDAGKKLAMFLKREADTKALLVRLQRQKTELTDLADESIAEDVNSFEKFKVSLKKVNAEIEAASEALLVLTDKIIPPQRKVGAECEKKLKPKILEFWKAPQRACEGEMRQKLDEIIRLRDDFESAFISTADGCGVNGKDLLGLTEIYGSVLPDPAHPRFGTIFTESKRARELERAVPEPVEPPQGVQDGQTPVEPTLDEPVESTQAITVLGVGL